MSPLIRYEEAEVRKKLEEKERQEEQQQKKQELKDDVKTSSEISTDPNGKNQLVIQPLFIPLIYFCSTPLCNQLYGVNQEEKLGLNPSPYFLVVDTNCIIWLLELRSSVFTCS